MPNRDEYPQLWRYEASLVKSYDKSPLILLLCTIYVCRLVVSLRNVVISCDGKGKEMISREFNFYHLDESNFILY